MIDKITEEIKILKNNSSKENSIKIRVLETFLRQPKKVLVGSRLVWLDLKKLKHRCMYFDAVLKDIEQIKSENHFKYYQLIEETYYKAKKWVLNQ